MKNCCEKLRPYAALFLRIGLGCVFTYHGFHKIFDSGMAFGTSWNPGGMSTIVQALVAWGEFLCGLGALLGFLTPLAAVGIIIIMGGAIVTVTGKNGFNMMNSGFEYNLVLIMMSLALLVTGSGPMALDNKCGCCCKGDNS